MLKAQIIGYLGKDCILNTVSGKQVINFNVAHSEKFTDNAGVNREKTIWVSCSYWAERTGIAAYLKKGTQVYVEGQIDAKTFTKDNGEVIAQLTCRVNMIQLLGGNKETQPERTLKQETEKSHYSAVEMKSDIPQNDGDLPF